LNGTELPQSNICRDLGVTITSDLSPSQHITEITLKAHQRADHIIRCFVSGDTYLLVGAFIVYVRPLLEYNSVIWSPSLIKDIDLIEQVQKRFTKHLRCLDGVAYTDRSQRLNLPSLELQRLHLDLVFFYKIVFGIVHINSDELFTLVLWHTQEDMVINCINRYV